MDGTTADRFDEMSRVLRDAVEACHAMFLLHEKLGRLCTRPIVLDDDPEEAARRMAAWRPPFTDEQRTALASVHDRARRAIETACKRFDAERSDLESAQRFELECEQAINRTLPSTAPTTDFGHVAEQLRALSLHMAVVTLDEPLEDGWPLPWADAVAYERVGRLSVGALNLRRSSQRWRREVASLNPIEHALPGESAPREDGAAEDDRLPALDETARLIVRALADAGPRRLLVVDLASHASRSRRTLAERLPRLREDGWVDYEPRRGATLTVRGRREAEALKPAPSAPR